MKRPDVDRGEVLFFFLVGIAFLFVMFLVVYNVQKRAANDDKYRTQIVACIVDDGKPYYAMNRSGQVIDYYGCDY